MTTLSLEDKLDIDPDWKEALLAEFRAPYMRELAEFVAKERAGPIPIYPPKNEVFNAFKQTPFDQVKVVIIGQDPYHGPGQAQGLCFSVAKGVPIPPSLQNIYKELQSDLEIPPASHGSLISWAKQGVLLLNATLTVRQGEPLSHHGKGWERFTDAAIKALKGKEVIYLLWGRSAKQKVLHVVGSDSKLQRLILTAPHPSPLSAHSGFFGCRHFSKCNELLIGLGKEPIDWSIR